VRRVTAPVRLALECEWEKRRVPNSQILLSLGSFHDDHTCLLAHMLRKMSRTAAIIDLLSGRGSYVPRYTLVDKELQARIGSRHLRCR